MGNATDRCNRLIAEYRYRMGLGLGLGGHAKLSYVIGDSAHLIVSAVLQTDPTWISLQMYYLATLHDD